MDGLLHVLFLGFAVSPAPKKAGDLPALFTHPQFHGLGGIAKRNADHEGSAFALFAGNCDRAVVTEHRTLGNRKTKSRAADFPGSGFVHPVKAFENTSLCLFRDSDAVVHDGQLKVLMVRVHCHDHLAVNPVIFDSVFHQVGHNLADPGRVHFREHLFFIDQRQLYITQLGDRPDPLHHTFREFVDVRPLDHHLRVGPVFFYQGQKIRDDFIFAVDLMVDILQKLPVYRRIHILFRQEGRGQNLHGSHRSLELMRHIRDELLAGLVQGIHPPQNVVEGIRYMDGLDILRRADGLVGIPLLDFTDIPGQNLEGPHQGTGDQNGSNEDDDKHEDLQQKSFSSQYFLGLLYILCRSAGDQNTPYRAGLGLIGCSEVADMDCGIQVPHGSRLHDRHDDFDKTVLGVVALTSAAALHCQTADHVLRDDRLVLRETICIFYDRQRGINDQKPPVIESRELRELGIDLP